VNPVSDSPPPRPHRLGPKQFSRQWLRQLRLGAAATAYVSVFVCAACALCDGVEHLLLCCVGVVVCQRVCAHCPASGGQPSFRANDGPEFASFAERQYARDVVLCVRDVVLCVRAYAGV
jgi:hypothetical protein